VLRLKLYDASHYFAAMHLNRLRAITLQMETWDGSGHSVLAANLYRSDGWAWSLEMGGDGVAPPEALVAFARFGPSIAKEVFHRDAASNKIKVHVFGEMPLCPQLSPALRSMLNGKIQEAVGVRPSITAQQEAAEGAMKTGIVGQGDTGRANYCLAIAWVWDLPWAAT
jgi:hypothetical protein